MAAPLQFQAFTMRASGIVNRIVSDIGVTAVFDPTAPPTPLPPHLSTKALCDTGATRSVLSTGFVTSLALTPVGTSKVHHGDGSSTRNTYLVNFDLPNKVRVEGVIATEFPASHNEFNVLVGMDVISLGDFSITNVSGKTWMSFRIPSCETIDYVVQANRLTFGGTPRNAPCPCGSGKKYKQCHGAA